MIRHISALFNLIYFLYQDPFLNSLEHQTMRYLLLKEHQSQASFAGDDQHTLAVVYDFRAPVREADC